MMSIKHEPVSPRLDPVGKLLYEVVVRQFDHSFFITLSLGYCCLAVHYYGWPEALASQLFYFMPAYALLFVFSYWWNRTPPADTTRFALPRMWIGIRMALFLWGVLMFFVGLDRDSTDFFKMSIIPSISIGCIGGCVDAALMRRVMVLKGITSFKEWCVRYLLPARWNKGATS